MTKLRVALMAGAVFALTASAFAQTQAPARDGVKPKSGTSRIRGRVVAADNGMPLRKATVRLSSPDLPQGRAKLTDADGAYDFPDLPAGSYFLLATKTGFIPVQYGATKPGDPGKRITVADGEVKPADPIVLSRAGAIAGRVVDEFGDPVADSQLNVLRYQSLGGVRRMTPAGMGGGRTNDLGQFRIYGLQPGSYYLAAKAPANMEAEVDDRSGYALTYYPGTANIGEAQPVQLNAGQDVTGIEIMLAQARVARIAGTALNASGRPATNSSVDLMAVEAGLTYGGPSGYGRVLPDGTFVINGVAPGDYHLELRVWPNPAAGPAEAQRTQYGHVRVTVAGADLSGVTIQATLGATISGQVVFEGTAAAVKPGMTVMAMSPPSLGPTYSSPGGQPIAVAGDGTFQMTGVFGERLFRVSGQPSGWFLKGVYVGNRDVTDTPLNVDGRDQVAGVQIVLTDRVTHLSGTVNDEQGQPADMAYVLVLPDDPRRLTLASRYQRAAMARAATPFKIDALPPGDYVAVAFVSAPQTLDYLTPEFLEYARKAGTRFSLDEFETKSLTLRAAALPER